MQYNSVSATRGLGMLCLSQSHASSFYVCAPFPFSAHPSFWKACGALWNFVTQTTNSLFLQQLLFTTHSEISKYPIVSFPKNTTSYWMDCTALSEIFSGWYTRALNHLNVAKQDIFTT